MCNGNVCVCVCMHVRFLHSLFADKIHRVCSEQANSESIRVMCLCECVWKIHEIERIVDFNESLRYYDKESSNMNTLTHGYVYTVRTYTHTNSHMHARGQIQPIHTFLRSYRLMLDYIVFIRCSVFHFVGLLLLFFLPSPFFCCLNSF